VTSWLSAWVPIGQVDSAIELFASQFELQDRPKNMALFAWNSVRNGQRMLLVPAGLAKLAEHLTYVDWAPMEYVPSPWSQLAGHPSAAEELGLAAKS